MTQRDKARGQSTVEPAASESPDCGGRAKILTGLTAGKSPRHGAMVKPEGKPFLVIGMADYHHRFEPILYGWLPGAAHYFVADRTQDDVFEIDKPQASEFHPTTKPVELIARMIANSSRPREVVFDPFCGSGSTLLAAHQLDRIGYAVEVSPAYVVTLERFAALGVKAKLSGGDETELKDSGA